MCMYVVSEECGGIHRAPRLISYPLSSNLVITQHHLNVCNLYFCHVAHILPHRKRLDNPSSRRAAIYKDTPILHSQ